MRAMRASSSTWFPTIWRARKWRSGVTTRYVYEYLAAINRFRTVVEKYPTTSHTPEALERLVECYLKLGVVDQAKRYAAVLGYNYPGSQWYKDAYALMNGKTPCPLHLMPSPAGTNGYHSHNNQEVSSR